MISDLVKKEFLGFQLLDVCATAMAVHHGQEFDLRTFDNSVGTFSRHAWNLDKISFEKRSAYLMRFFLQTSTTIALGAAADFPMNLEIPDDRVIGEIEITFSIEYVSETDPAILDGLSLRLLEKIRTPSDVWPYWRETLHGLASRTRLPLPALNVFRAPSPAKVAREYEEARLHRAAVPPQRHSRNSKPERA